MRELSQEGIANALDYSGGASDPLAVGDGQLVHFGWIYPHLAGLGSGCGSYPLDPRPKPSSVIQPQVDSREMPATNLGGNNN